MDTENDMAIWRSALLCDRWRSTSSKQSSRKHLDNNLQHSNIFHYFEQIYYLQKLDVKSGQSNGLRFLHELYGSELGIERKDLLKGCL